MRLLPISDADKSWASLKSQWRKAAESIEEDFSTYALGTFAVLDPLVAQGPSKAGLYGLYDGTVPHAFCQVNKILISKFEGPTLRARFMTVSPIYDFGSSGLSSYAQVLVELFSGIVWLARNSLNASHVLFHLRSPSDAQYLAALQASVAESPFTRFAIKGAWVECDLKLPDPA